MYILYIVYTQEGRCAVRTWAFVSQKGGAGRSTLATQLAVHAQECGEVVCLLDLDPQESATTWSQARGSDQPAVVPCTMELLQKMIAEAAKLGCTLMLLDTPPHHAATAVAAVTAAEFIVCPTRPSLFDIAALRDTADLLTHAGKKHLAIAVANCIPPTGAESAYGEAVAAVEALGLRICETHIGNRRAFVAAVGAGKGVTEIFRSDKASEELRQLWHELNRLSSASPKKTVVRSRAQ